MIGVYKMFNNLIDINIKLGARGYSLKLSYVKRRRRLDLRKHFFVNRAVNIWNSLKDVVAAPRLDSFKSRLDKIMDTSSP